MDIFSLLRMLGTLALLLGVLTAAMWAVRRYDLKLPGRVGGGSMRRLHLIDRLPIDARRSILLVRRDAVEHLLLIGTDHSLLLETLGHASHAPSQEQADA